MYVLYILKGDPKWQNNLLTSHILYPASVRKLKEGKEGKERSLHISIAKMKNFHRCKIIGLSAYSKTHAEEQLPNVYYSDCESADSIKAAKHSSKNCFKQFRNKRSDNISQGKGKISAPFQVIFHPQENFLGLIWKRKNTQAY